MDNIKPTSATASTPGVIIPAYIAQIAASSRLNLSPKVAIPGFVGLGAVAITCELKHWGFNIDLGSTMLGIVWVMIMLGWVVPDGKAIVKASAQHALDQEAAGAKD